MLYKEIYCCVILFKSVRRCDIGVCYTKCYPNTFHFYFHDNVSIHIDIKCCLIIYVCIFVNFSFAIYSLPSALLWLAIIFGSCLGQLCVFEQSQLCFKVCQLRVFTCHYMFLINWISFCNTRFVWHLLARYNQTKHV